MLNETVVADQPLMFASTQLQGLKMNTPREQPRGAMVPPMLKLPPAAGTLNDLVEGLKVIVHTGTTDVVVVDDVVVDEVVVLVVVVVDESMMMIDELVVLDVLDVGTDVVDVVLPTVVVVDAGAVVVVELPTDVVVDVGTVVVVAAMDVVGGSVLAGGFTGADNGDAPPQVSICAPGVQFSA